MMSIALKALLGAASSRGEPMKTPNRNRRSNRARLRGDGAIAQGQNATAAGAGAVVVRGNNTGDINTGTHIVLSEIGTLNLSFNQPTEMAAGLVRQIVLQSPALPKSVAADLDTLMKELRRTHQTLVTKLDPVWNLKDNPATFAKRFDSAFTKYRTFYLSKDLGEERTHCHVLGQIGRQLAAARPKGDASDATWQQLESLLRQLNDYDIDVIEEHYRPFMDSVYKTLNQINALIGAGDVAQAIQLKQALVAQLEKDYAAMRANFDEMGDIIGKINTTMKV
jgi:hypothetical protein